jgi:hypothetical protein
VSMGDFWSAAIAITVDGLFSSALMRVAVVAVEKKPFKRFPEMLSPDGASSSHGRKPLISQTLMALLPLALTLPNPVTTGGQVIVTVLPMVSLP